MEDSTRRLTLPSGAWADFRTSLTYGARRQLRHYAANISATTTIAEDGQPGGMTLPGKEMAVASEAAAYYPLVYLLAAWSFDSPLPTMADLTPLDALSWEDGEFLFEEARKVFDNASKPVDFSANKDPKGKAPITNLDEPNEPSEASPSINGGASRPKLSSTRS